MSQIPSAEARGDRYTTVAIFMHWLIAGAIVFQILLGWRMGWAPKGSALSFALFQLHKSVGITILLLSLARLAWRLFNPPPKTLQARWAMLASGAVHIGFYVIMIGLPLTGWIMVSASKTNIPTLLYGVIPWPHLPVLPDLAAGPKQAWDQAGAAGHGLLVKLTYALLALHLGAVAKHQLIDRDAVFSHMAAGGKPGWSEPRLWLAAAIFAGIVAFGYLYAPGIKAAPPPRAPAAPADQSLPPSASSATPAASSAAPIPASSAPPAEAPQPAVAWSVRKASTLAFTAAWSGQPIEGHFDRWSGDILFSPTDLTGSHVTISVDLGSVSTGDAQRDATLPTADWFDAATDPKAVFSAAKFRKTGEGRFIADGTLELRGVRKPISLPFSLKIDGKTARVHGVVTLDRTAFGVGQGDWSSTDAVPAGVKVTISVIADPS